MQRTHAKSEASRASSGWVTFRGRGLVHKCDSRLVLKI